MVFYQKKLHKTLYLTKKTIFEKTLKFVSNDSLEKFLIFLKNPTFFKNDIFFQKKTLFYHFFTYICEPIKFRLEKKLVGHFCFFVYIPD